MTTKSLTLTRNIVFSLLGLTLLSYALGVFIAGRPDPFWPLAPALAGGVTALVVTLGGLIAGRKAAAITWDEMARHEWRGCLQFGYWVAVWLYPIFAVLLINDAVDYTQAFAAMGTLTGAAPFLMFLAKWIRGRV